MPIQIKKWMPSALLISYLLSACAIISPPQNMAGKKNTNRTITHRNKTRPKIVKSSKRTKFHPIKTGSSKKPLSKEISDGPFWGHLYLTPQVISSDRQVKITATFWSDSGYFQSNDIINSATLYRVDPNDNNRMIEAIANFNDAGHSGDAIPQDGEFTAQAIVAGRYLQEVETMFAAEIFTSTHPSGISFAANILKAKTDISYYEGPWAIDDQKNLFFRNADGKRVKTLGKDLQTLMISLDQRHIATTDAKRRNFFYVDESGILWKKIPTINDRAFCFNLLSLSISGERIALTEVDADSVEGGGCTNPVVTIYDQAGKTVLREEKLPLSTLDLLQLSSNGRYLLLEGVPITPDSDLTTLVIIDINNPLNRLTESYSGLQISESIVENESGNFEVWHNNIKRYSFPF
ncbi:MAG: hypothetical protein A2504_05065 [Bdellovibrionales bacterium RIFOXYD12_FULL_39_22]|nr:MAG: hypothetical protein A2385_06760 [Bdellovibrionales bacterium RIFOXYB1_FULL_39_21]OFZ41972.1 MAG: hypothetical protein A2485_08730 [Bdellovibrionales bacterium RIFOXYC12_FULL_39_17]OFZ50688.1 MAG: hypothetical protein A2404_05680 [Bdellovibrionales bacterium RIFOXYC1_FULL_39_130]OFZ77911.1 MAG: hypothetical protein A2560_00850 [Bdellovibrionales bacterium RIFOXYD1_FULL_39_84]OFZ93653.1 MAG: hypothetical protein A2504_05065 [Bdellovibrionales bacterium RIFOXYD12_FULL_39_22]HLE10213.1 hy